jgi:hypothetical protein
MYGISKNPGTENYIILNKYFCENYCKDCDNIYSDIHHKWCRMCQINYLKETFTNWTSENEKVDNFIKEMQLKINKYNDIIFEWIPYDQFERIEEVGTRYFAIWKDGPLEYNDDTNKYKRDPNKTVNLKFYNKQDINEFLEEV